MCLTSSSSCRAILYRDFNPKSSSPHRGGTPPTGRAESQQLRLSNSRTGTCRLFHAQESGEIEPLEKCLHHLKTIASKQIDILLQTIWDQNVFQCLPLTRDFSIRVAVPALEFVVEVNKQPVHIAVVGEDLLGHDQHAIVDQSVIDPADQVISSERADELERPAHRNHAGVTQFQIR